MPDRYNAAEDLITRNLEAGRGDKTCTSSCRIAPARSGRGVPEPRDGHAADEALAEELVEFARGRMASYKRPRRVVFVRELPKTATGKIQRFKLRRV